MKELEKEYRTYLPKRSFAVIRVDGKGFSKYTKGLEKPFDTKFTLDMRQTARYLADNIDGAVCAYTQSDEISVILSDLGGENTEWWFGGAVQKMVSLSAAMATAKFNSLRKDESLALFDARVHHLNGEEGVLNYLRWRQDDAIKNSVGMLASHYFSHKELTGVSTADRVIRLSTEKGVSWYNLAPMFQMGSLVRKEKKMGSTDYWQNGERKHIEFERNVWVVEDAPRFKDADQLGTGMRKALLRVPPEKALEFKPGAIVEAAETFVAEVNYDDNEGDDICQKGTLGRITRLLGDNHVGVQFQGDPCVYVVGRDKVRVVAENA